MKALECCQNIHQTTGLMMMYSDQPMLYCECLFIFLFFFLKFGALKYTYTHDFCVNVCAIGSDLFVLLITFDVFLSSNGACTIAHFYTYTNESKGMQKKK